MKTKTRKDAKNETNGASNGKFTDEKCGNVSKLDNHLITEYFPSVARVKRVTAKALAVEQEKQITYYIANNCDPKAFVYVVDVDGKGKGVICASRIRKGDFICEYAGELIKKSDATEREKVYEISGEGCYMYYFSWGGVQWCVDATKPSQRIGRLINHSRKQPNCKTRLFIHRDTPHLIFIALRDIQPNEEILYDYGEMNKLAIEAHPWLSST